MKKWVVTLEDGTEAFSAQVVMEAKDEVDAMRKVKARVEESQRESDNWLAGLDWEAYVVVPDLGGDVVVAFADPVVEE